MSVLGLLVFVACLAISIYQFSIVYHEYTKWRKRRSR